VDGDIDIFGNINMWADDSITLGDNVLEDYVDAGGSLNLNAQGGITLNGPVESGSAMWIKADTDDNGSGDVVANSSLNSLSGGLGVTGDNITVEGTIDSGAWINMVAADHILLNDVAKASGTINLNADAGTGIDAGDGVGSIDVHGLASSGGNITLSASDSTINIHKSADPTATSDVDVDAFGDIMLNNDTVTDAGVILKAGDDVVLANEKSMDGLGNLTIEADDDILLGVDIANHETNPSVGTAGDVSANGDLTLDAGDDIYAHGDLTSTNGSIYISSATQQQSPTTTYTWGDITAAVDVWLDTAVSFQATDDQFVTAQTGSITANGWLSKGQSSLYVKAASDISLADYVEAYSGGVSIISESGKIFTPGGSDDTLNVRISGRSDDEAGTGVDLPYGPGKAAIVIMSAEDLKLGLGADGAELDALGVYDTSGAVDDRQGVGFLDVPATIGGVPRNEGDAFDVAVYLASTEGDVDVSSPVMIGSFEYQYEGEEFTPQGAMVIDAFDSVTFDDITGGDFEDSLAGDLVGDRLEVCSRITEWLFQAVGRLPYAGGGGPFVPDYTYVLRGAGLGSGITDGRAWVLEDPLEPAPLYTETGEKTEEQTLGVAGCPALIAAAADELGIAEDELNVFMATAMAAATDIQPCETCARLVDAATILRDENGSRMAAMVQTFNTLAPADAPFTPATAASIATAFEGAAEGTQYASAMEYIDAFVQYVAVLDTEMGSPVDDSLAFVMEKHGAGITENENTNIAAFVATRLESLETFGD
ncbi:MAG: autotransporter outer membrane beta-barrel domain-containing protein, partial [Planctomycetota bacterium]